MNIHHLELFYYAAKYEGITAAVRKMPYGIQQPAMSAQILQLEEDLGVKLFNRRPFALTPAGDDLYDFIYPFFSRLPQIEEHLKGEESRHLRLAASASTLRNHLPDVLDELRKTVPGLKLSLKEVEQSDVLPHLLNQQADIAIGVITGRLTEGMKAEPLVSLPLALMVPTKMKIKTWKDAFEPDPESTNRRGKLPLIGLPECEVLQQIFQRELSRKKIKWPVEVEVNSLETIKEYVVKGFGIGIGVSIPENKPPKGVKEVLLTDFPPLVVGALYQGSPKPLVLDFLKAAKKRAAKMAK